MGVDGGMGCLAMAGDPWQGPRGVSAWRSGENYSRRHLAVRTTADTVPRRGQQGRGPGRLWEGGMPVWGWDRCWSVLGDVPRAGDGQPQRSGLV